MDYSTLYHTEGIRCYNGAFDSKSERVFKAQDKCLDEIKKAEPKASITHFPMGEFWLVFVGYRQLSGIRHKDKQGALIEAYEKLVLKNG